MKWLSILGRNFRDTVLMGFGAWIIWTQVYAKNPNGYLAVIGFACMVPSGRAAIISILSETSPSSQSSQSREAPPEPPSSQGGTGEHKA